MDLNMYVDIAQKGIETAVWVAAPVLLMGLVAGLAVSIFQAATQINDAALAFIPKIGAVVISLILFGPFMISRISEFTQFAFERIARVLP
jgi:flagellar biosynthetic protein FliQ